MITRYIVIASSLIPASLMLGGCATWLQAATETSSDDLRSAGNWNKFKGMVGDRRGARFAKMVPVNDPNDPSNHMPLNPRFLICMEPYPGAILARGSTSNATATGYGGLDNALSQSALAVDQRADVVRLYQDAHFRWCMARSAGEISRKEYIDRLYNLDALAFAALKKPETPPTPKCDAKKAAEIGAKCP